MMITLWKLSSSTPQTNTTVPHAQQLLNTQRRDEAYLDPNIHGILKPRGGEDGSLIAIQGPKKGRIRQRHLNTYIPSLKKAILGVQKHILP